MKLSKIFLALLAISTFPAIASEGVIQVASHYDVKQTADRLKNILDSKGMTVFNRIDHAEAAKKIGVEIRPTELLIFGNPKVGSPLMQCQQQVAIDLPQKALVWEDENAKVWISYNDPRYLETRHSITGCEDVLAKIEKALAGMVKSAAE